jgi:fatty-acyl-CoA synthase
MTLPTRTDRPTHLLDVMHESRSSHTPHLSVWTAGRFEHLTWDDWRSQADRCARGARALGIHQQKPVPCVLTNSPAVCAAIPGLWLAGGCVASLPTPARGMSLEGYIRQLASILDRLDADILLMEQAYADALPPDVIPGVRVVTFESLLGSGPAYAEVPSAEQVIFVQYSSGSTGEPRGCMLQARAIEAQLDILAEGLSLDPVNDQGVMWLPLSHDMGLFGCLMLSFVKGLRLVISTPERFIRSPRTWLSDCADFQATITAAPNFALDLASRAARVSPPRHFPMRKCVIGGERIEPATIACATTVLGASGLAAKSLVPAYGLAEAVLAVTMTALDKEPRVVTVDSASLLEGQFEPRDDEIQSSDGTSPPGVTRLVSNGVPLRGVEVDVHGGDIGEIWVRSPALTLGYVNDPAATDTRLHDGVLHTRDLGFQHDGELYVYGRSDDMINYAGRNIWARDIEAAITASLPIRPGSCALIDVHDDGGQRLVVVAEPATSVTDFTMLASSASRVAYESAGINVHECLVVRPGTVPKTPSGKIQRFRCRSLTDPDAVTPLARVVS